MKIINIFATVSCFIISSSLIAQSVFVTPKNIAPLGTVSTGNTVAGKCDGNSRDYMKVNLQPSCYGANLRGGGNVLDPNHGNVILDLSVSNGGSVFNSSIEFPNKVTWPDNYGQTCTWDNQQVNGTVSCALNTGVTTNYTCNYKNPGSFHGDYLECARLYDPNSDGVLNKDISCGFMYTWAGEGQAASTSYKKINGVVSCGLTDKNLNLANLVNVTSTTQPSMLKKSAKRGNVVIDYIGLDRKKINVTKQTTDGKFNISGTKSNVTTKFFQIKNGVKVPLTQKVEAGFDEFEECLNIKVAFIGENKFCGSYYSPIMMFFDETRPSFVGRSSFPLVDGYQFVSWTEPEAPGYFLALDVRGDKKVLNKNQLFGDGTGYPNGFEALKALDSNGDGVINKKDKSFKKLVLWRDINGDGISDKGEVITLDSMKVTSISLDYKDDNRVSFGRTAEARQYASFTYGDKDQKGSAIDIWFSPVAMEK